MADFIPDSEFVPDKPAQAMPASLSQPGANADFIPDHQFVSDEDRFGTPIEQFKTILEGGARGVLGPIATGIERMLGVPAEHIRGREAANPWESKGAEAGTFLGSSIAGFGLPGVLGKAGQLAAEAIPLGGAAVKGAIKLGTEGAAYQAANELHQLFESNPEQTIGTAIAHTGMAAALAPVAGIALKGAEKLWDVKYGSKLSSVLQGIKDLSPEGVPRGTSEMANSSIISDLAQSAIKHGAAAAVAATGHPWAAGALDMGLSKILPKFFPKEAPEALQIGLARFLAKPIEANPLAFRAVVKLADQASHGIKAVDAALKGLIPAGASLAVREMTPKDEQTLKDAADKYQTDPNSVLQVDPHLGPMEPAHGAAKGGLMVRSLETINAARPNLAIANPLDRERTPNRVEQAHYDRTVQLVQNPLNILPRIKDGSISPADLKTHVTVYPDMHKLISQKIQEKLIEAKIAGEHIPSPTRIGMSMYLGRPLDSTMSPGAIASNQPIPKAPTGGGGPQNKRKQGTAPLSKLPSLYALHDTEMDRH